MTAIGVDARSVPPRALRRRESAKAIWRSLRADKVALAGAGYLLLVVVIVVFGDLIRPHDPAAIELRDKLIPPMFFGGTKTHILGTDPLGRDILSRIILGARTSVSIGVAVVMLSALIGATLGLLAGYYERWVSAVVMRLVDVVMAFPSLLLALTVLALLGPSAKTIVAVLVFNTWPVFAKSVRDEVLSMRSATFLTAAETLGCSPGRVMRRHVLPNVAPLLATVATLELAQVILAEASLSYLGFGLQPPATSWGLMISVGQPFVTTAVWTVVFPGIALALTILAVNIVATWLRTSRVARISGASVDAGLVAGDPR